MATYGSTAGAGAMVPTWNGTSNPTSAQVTAWLTDGCAQINRALASAGYTTPVDATAAAYAELTGLENLYAAAYILRSQAIDVASGDTEARSEVWLKDFYARLKSLAASNLSLLGVSPLPSTTARRRRRIGTVQMRKVDGYSRGPVSDSAMPISGEYTGYTPPSE